MSVSNGCRFHDLVEAIHAVPGRIRFRYRPLRTDAQEHRAGEIADRLVEQAGVLDVSVKPATGSIVVVYDAARVSAIEIGRRVRTATGAERLLGIGEPLPPMAPRPSEPSRLAVAAAKFFEELNEDVRNGTEGHADLATLMPVGFVGLGLVEVAATRELPAPPWWSLFWWSFRAFLSLNVPAIEEARDGAPASRATSVARSDYR